MPGGPMTCAGVTVVGVHPTHRRRGILRRMMTTQLADIRERGEPIASLWASEDTIYGRYGSVPRRECARSCSRAACADLRSGLPPREGQVRLVDHDEAMRAFPRIYDGMRRASAGVRLAARSTGGRSGPSTTHRSGAAAPGRSTASLLELDGRPVGYAIYRIAQHPTEFKRTLRVQEALGLDARSAPRHGAQQAGPSRLTSPASRPPRPSRIHSPTSPFSPRRSRPPRRRQAIRAFSPRPRRAIRRPTSSLSPTAPISPRARRAFPMRNIPAPRPIPARAITARASRASPISRNPIPTRTSAMRASPRRPGRSASYAEPKFAEPSYGKQNFGDASFGDASFEDASFPEPNFPAPSSPFSHFKAWYRRRLFRPAAACSARSRL